MVIFQKDVYMNKPRKLLKQCAKDEIDAWSALEIWLVSTGIYFLVVTGINESFKKCFYDKTQNNEGVML